MSETPGEAEQAAALVEQVVEVVDRQPRPAREMEERRGIDVARPRAHHQALERREPHRRLHRASAVDRRDRRAVAEVEDDLPEVGEQVGRRTPRPPRSRTCARCRGIRSGGCGGMPRARRRWRTCRPRAGASGGTPCRTRRRAARRGTRASPRRCPAGSPGLCSGASTESSSMLISTSGVMSGRLEEPRPAVHDAVPDGDGRMRLERRTVLGERVEHDREPGRVVGDRELARVRGVEERRGRLVAGPAPARTRCACELPTPSPMRSTSPEARTDLGSTCRSAGT